MRLIRNFENATRKELSKDAVTLKEIVQHVVAHELTSLEKEICLRALLIDEPVGHVAGVRTRLISEIVRIRREGFEDKIRATDIDFDFVLVEDDDEPVRIVFHGDSENWIQDMDDSEGAQFTLDYWSKAMSFVETHPHIAPFAVGPTATVHIGDDGKAYVTMPDEDITG